MTLLASVLKPVEQVWKQVSQPPAVSHRHLKRRASCSTSEEPVERLFQPGPDSDGAQNPTPVMDSWEDTSIPGPPALGSRVPGGQLKSLLVLVSCGLLARRGHCYLFLKPLE